TSGSTGRPKGVVHTHRFILHVSMNYTNSLHLCADDRVGVLKSFGLSAGMKITYGPLFSGATLCPFDLKAEGLARLADWLIQAEITLCNVSPSFFRQFIGTLTPAETFPRFRVLECAGERVYKTDWELYKKHFPPDCLMMITYAGGEFGPL